MRTLMLLPCLCALTACAASTSGDLPSLTVPCAVPEVLPDRALTQGEVELAWGRDRGALRDCGERMAVLADRI